MNLLIISCTPRIKEKSNTDKILDEFKKGYESNGNTTETLYLYQRNEWEIIRKKFYENDSILFALPEAVNIFVSMIFKLPDKN